MTEDHSAVRLELNSRPEAPALVRAALSGIAQSLELDSELFDDLKTAVSEACNNAVLYAYEGEPGPLRVELEIRPDEVDATIRDWGGGIQHVGPSDERMGVGLAVISALADRTAFISAPDGGTEVRMSFTRRSSASLALPGGHDGDLPGGHDADLPGGHDADLPDGHDADLPRDVPVQLSGDVVVTVWPVGLLPDVMGRVARALAARTHLSLDRFADIYLVADAVAALAQSAAVSAAITFAVTAAHKRLELTVGPFRAADGASLLEEGALTEPPGSPLGPVVDELAFEPVGDHELLRVVIQERRESRPR